MTSKRWASLITTLVAGLIVACSGGPDSADVGSRQKTDTPQATSPPGDQKALAVATATIHETPPGTETETSTWQAPPPALEVAPVRQQAGPPLDSTGGFFDGPDAKWPDYVPADIPVLDGEIEVLVVVPGSFIRMRYTNITEEEIAQYLTVLKKEGFNLKGIVYVEPGFPDRSEEKLARGDYDAIDITRGEYSMQLAYGGGEASYLINTASFLPAPDRPTPTAVNVQWPDDIADLAPPPQNCPLTALVRLNPSGYEIRCAQSSVSVLADYVDVLESQGFSELNRLVNDQGELVELTLVKGGQPLTLMPLHSGDLLIVIRPAVAWPDDIAALAPPPRNCPLSVVTELSPTGYHIRCKQGGQSVVADYVETLRSLGFTEQERIQDSQGDLVELTLAKGGETVTLSPLLTIELTIEIRPSLKWPDAIADLAPPPERCVLTSVTESSSGAYHISCTREGEGVVVDYADALAAWGYTEQTRVQDDAGEVSLLELVKEDATVNLWPAPPDYMGIDIRPGGP